MLIDKEQYEKARADFGKTWTAGAIQSIDETKITDQAPRQRNPDHRCRRKHLLPQAPRQHHAGGHQGWRQRHSPRLRPERKLPRHRIKCWRSRWRAGGPGGFGSGGGSRVQASISTACSAEPVALALYVASSHHDLASAVRVATRRAGYLRAQQPASPRPSPRTHRTVPARREHHKPAAPSMAPSSREPFPSPASASPPPIHSLAESTRPPPTPAATTA